VDWGVVVRREDKVQRLKMIPGLMKEV
jgi:hypothetical protein